MDTKCSEEAAPLPVFLNNYARQTHQLCICCTYGYDHLALQYSIFCNAIIGKSKALPVPLFMVPILGYGAECVYSVAGE